MMSKTFQKGDSNRCRTVYERILRAHVPGKEFDAQKKSQRVSVGRCRMLAINYSVALPSYEALSRVRFVVASVPREEWSVPIDCERFEKNLLVETMCRGPCSTCGILQTAGDNDGRQPMAQSAAPLLAFALRQQTHAAEGPESQGEAQAIEKVPTRVPSTSERADPVAGRGGTFGCTPQDWHAGLHDVTVGDAYSGRTRSPLGVATPAPADDPFTELDLDCLRDLPETLDAYGTLLQTSHAFEPECAELTCPGLYPGLIEGDLPLADISEHAGTFFDLCGFCDPYSEPSLWRNSSGSSGSSWSDSDVSSVLSVALPVRPELAASGASVEEHGFASPTGDSNRCRNVSEKILPPISKGTHNVGGKRRKTFHTGDSNRCRTVYEQILRAHVPGKKFDAQKLNKHVSIGRCRMLAIDQSVALPSYEAVSRAGFVGAKVPLDEWSVPTDCKRFKRSREQDGFCSGPCETCQHA